MVLCFRFLIGMGKSINNPHCVPQKRLQKYYFFLNQQPFFLKKTSQIFHYSVFQCVTNHTRRTYCTQSPVYFARNRLFFYKIDPQFYKLFYLKKNYTYHLKSPQIEVLLYHILFQNRNFLQQKCNDVAHTKRHHNCDKHIERYAGYKTPYPAIYFNYYQHMYQIDTKCTL